jgi:hypothetical protein
MPRFVGEFDPVTDPTVVYDQYSTGGAETIDVPPVPGSVAVTTINGLSGPTVTFSGGTTGLSFAPSGTTITLNGTLVIANGGTGATTAAGARANLGLAKQNITAAPPTVNDDSTQGYSGNSLWQDTSGTPDVYVCTDAAIGNAQWTRIAP